MFTDKSDYEDLFGHPDGASYLSTQTRTGPPLDYVAEKARGSLEFLHFLLKNIEQYVPENLPLQDDLAARGASVKQDLLFAHAWTAFRFGVVSYLALLNMLRIANDNGIFDWLVSLPHKDFIKWLDGIDKEGSVVGENLQ